MQDDTDTSDTTLYKSGGEGFIVRPKILPLRQDSLDQLSRGPELLIIYQRLAQ